MEKSVVIVTGKLIKCRKEAKTFKGKKGDVKTYLTLKDANINDKDMELLKEAFKKSGEKFTPEWVKNFEGFINVSTVYDIPCKHIDGQEYKDVLECVADHDFYNAACRLSLNVKEGAVYPKSICIDTDGEPYNAFAEFDD